MIKNLRKFMMLLMALVSVSAFADETVTFDFNATSTWSDNVYSNVNSAKTSASGTNIADNKLECDGVTLLFENVATTQWCITSQYGGGSLYSASNNIVTIVAPEGKAIAGFTATCANSFGYGVGAAATQFQDKFVPAGTGSRNPNGGAPYLVIYNAPEGGAATVKFTAGATLIYTKLEISLIDAQGGGNNNPVKEEKTFDITEVTNNGNAAGTVKEWVNSYVVTVPEGTELKGAANSITLNIPEFTSAYKCQGVEVNGTKATLSFANVLENVIVDGDYTLTIPAGAFGYETDTEVYKNNAYTATWTLSNAPAIPELGNLGWNMKYGMSYKQEELAISGVEVFFGSDDAKQATAENKLYVQAVLSGMNNNDEGYTTVANGLYQFTQPMGAENPTAAMFADAFGGEVYDQYRVEIMAVVYGEAAYDEMTSSLQMVNTIHVYEGTELEAICPLPMAFSVEKAQTPGGDDSVIGTPKAVYKNGAVYIQFEGAKFSEVCNDPNGWYDFTISGHTIDGNIEYYAAYEMDPAKYNEVQVSQDGTVLAEGEHTLVIPAGQFMIAYTDPTTWAAETLYQNAEDIVITFTVGGEEPSGDAVTVTAEVADGLTKIYVTYNNYKNADGGDNNIDLTNLSTYAMYSAEPWGVIDDSNNTVEYRIYEALPAGNYEVVINQGAAFVSNSNITYDESEYNQAATASLEIKAQGGGNEGGEGDVPTHDTILTAGGVEIVDGGSYSAADVASWTVKTVGEAKTGYMFVAKLFGGKMQSDPDMGSYWVEGSDEYVADVVVDNNHQFTATFATTIPAGQYRLLCRMVNTTTWDWVVDTELYITVSEATSINAINEAVKNAVKFNLSGQRVNNAKGIVIMNGKKILK